MIDALNNAATASRTIAGRAGPAGSPPSGAAVRAESDAVELSGAASEHVGTAERPVRTNLVQRIRAEIAAGTYLTDEKLDAAIDGLMRDASRGR